MQIIVSIIGALFLGILLAAWLSHRALQRKSCCGTCGCNLMSEKAKKKMLAKRKKRASNS